MRRADPPIRYLVGAPKGRPGQLEQALLGQSWWTVRRGVEVKFLPQQEDFYVLA